MPGARLNPHVRLVSHVVALVASATEPGVVPALDVLCVRYGFEVARVDAASVAAQVVEIHVVGYWPAMRYVERAVRQRGVEAGSADVAVAVREHWAGPLPAAVVLDMEAGEVVDSAQRGRAGGLEAAIVQLAHAALQSSRDALAVIGGAAWAAYSVVALRGAVSDRLALATPLGVAVSITDVSTAVTTCPHVLHHIAPCYVWPMPGRPKDPRVNVSVRISQEGIDAIQEFADVEQRTWSEMLRLVLADGITYRNQQRRKR